MTFLAWLACVQALAGAYDPQGVHVDPQGVLRSRSVTADPRLAEIRKAARAGPTSGKLLHVSLPRLMEEVRRLQEAKRPIPPELRHLGGLTKLQYVFVFPEEKDLVVAGPAEPFDGQDAFRPLGRLTGRPLLHLDDLATALRAFAPGARPDRLGCDIDVTREMQERAAAKIRAIGPAAQIAGIQKTCDRIAEEAGPQPVRFYGIDPDTRFGFVCVEADYRLKQLALGTLPSPAAAVKSYRSLLSKPEPELRFSLESDYEALRASPDGLSFELRGASLKVNGGLLGRPETRPEDMPEPGRSFVELCNANFEALQRGLPSWGDLCNLGDLSVLAALLVQDGLAEKADWDPSWLREGFAWRSLPAPKTAATLCAVSIQGRAAVFLTGGVWLHPIAWTARRAEDPAWTPAPVRPREGWRTRP
jgi:hypothetical protein